VPSHERLRFDAGEENDLDILFPAFPDAVREPDPAFWREWEAIKDLNIPWRIVELEAFMDRNYDRAFRHLPQGSGQTVLYRGWILKEHEYRDLETQLHQRGYRLFTPTASYAGATFFPNYYPGIRHLTPPAVWSEGSDPESAWRRAQTLGRSAYIIKDYVKSVKELWDKACYIREEATKDEFCDACRHLVKVRGDRFEGGIVVRPFVPLRFLDTSAFGPQPIFEEYRLFFLQGQLLWSSRYDRVGGEVTDFSAFLSLGRLIPSPFFSADVAVTEDGRLILIELGDGGASGLPRAVPVRDFYERLWSMARYGSSTAESTPPELSARMQSPERVP
jgi:hypothetical protein